MEATTGIAPSQALLPSEIQPGQPPVSVEQNLFDYMVEVEKGMGVVGGFNDPSAFLGSALETVDGVAQQLKNAFEDVATRSENVQADNSATENVPQGESGMREANTELSTTLDRAISVMWAAANASMAVNGMTAASSSANTLIKQQ
ncbi:hypothetical protein [uncultured Nitratireductor sp.]|uniref:hypothetical protein n=1 Tax=uncultured Nitratireductor sp. TaxID=520953 RepID=UPI0025F106D3|nr:hypothetical protein [uncultured Nitratireductor sp.]